jgi:hypothetical protein
MFEKREEVPEFHPKDCAQPSLEAIMALQKMLEDGLLDQLDEIPETPPSVVHPAIDRAARARLDNADRSIFQTVCCFIRDLAYKLHLVPARKKPTGGKSAHGIG